MNKVVCDLCGTSYPETATQCPICGCVRSGDAVVVGAEASDSGAYTYVKGGRFSKSNVRKRNQNTVSESEETSSEKSNKKFAGLLIVLLALIVIIAFMITMIVITWNEQKNQNFEGSQSTSVACTNISLSQSEIVLTAENEVWLLDVSVEPAGCTDQVVFYSKNPSIVTVSETGKLTCLAEGEAVIIVECGGYSARCVVSCQFPEETVLPTVEPESVHLNRLSITADFEGFSWQLYSGDIPVEDIIWLSDDPTVATFENGIVTAVAEGKTMIHAEYNGIRTSCEIICNFQIPDDQPSDQEGESATEYVLYTMYNTKPKYNEDLKAYDITISMKEGPVGLFLKDNLGNKIELEWSIVDGDSCRVNGTYVTVWTSVSNCKIKAEYNGVTYYCYIRTIN